MLSVIPAEIVHGTMEGKKLTPDDTPPLIQPLDRKPKFPFGNGGSATSGNSGSADGGSVVNHASGAGGVINVNSSE